jgi:hypothetical protein
MGRPGRRIPVLLALSLLFAVGTGPLSPVAAQTPPPARTLYPDIPPPVGEVLPVRPIPQEEDNTIAKQSALLHLATHSTELMVVGLLTGGLMMNWLVGGTPATLLGTAAGAVVANWLFFDRASEQYIVKQVH